jgi:hypothetical protein
VTERNVVDGRRAGAAATSAQRDDGRPAVAAATSAQRDDDGRPTGASA